MNTDRHLVIVAAKLRYAADSFDRGYDMIARAVVEDALSILERHHGPSQTRNYVPCASELTEKGEGK